MIVGIQNQLAENWEIDGISCSYQPTFWKDTPLDTIMSQKYPLPKVTYLIGPIG